MSDPAKNINIAHHYGGIIYHPFSSHGVVLPFVSLMTEIQVLIQLQWDTLKFFCSPFKKPIMVHEDN